MSAPVDVLEAIRQACGRDALPYAVHVAVAELIEAAKFARLTGNGPTGYTPGADRRLAAALARVQPSGGEG